ncbi:hypothetical protein Arnit_2434 [Arcobacter nitrofigilis DSM 7299]|uniref:Uncharacterized protein n=1 Tax=Arcobacter nitrofigilis (strain ATCC 33309 / DSM 7299 / CCUG 15893 / LMG 7604 / NCTC 12251 / CI) TaxID=572480 RepID=D5V1C2_ARCNC|nr:hypothetical protein [Arcobacter nitrofigilis]ADG94084.1 hypothetical protein Arnit_2434 [Arcobacter nitrofigilis DSM 7299]
MYGITNEDMEYIESKIEKQKQFLKNFSIDFADKSVSMLDNTYSANLNPKKYFAEINNRVNSLFDYAKDNGLRPVFVISEFEKYVFDDIQNAFLRLPVVPSRLSDYKLDRYYRLLDNLDIKDLDLVHF